MNNLLNLGGLVSSSDWVIFVRLAVAVLMGALIGLEREWLGRTAGLRTHALVSMGAALFTITSLMIFSNFLTISGVVGYDQHIVANIIVGIGFIGGGAILRSDKRVQGVTTAASLWVAAAIGMAAGFGFYKEAIFATILAYVIQLALRPLERRIKGRANDTYKMDKNDEPDKELQE
jgi:putative Mg2+ transporter-C (MgtC) family protein